MNEKPKISIKSKTKDISYIALFAALISVCAWISVPTAIPFTMQTFGVFLTLEFLGGKKGGASVLLYLFSGMIGLPVFANGASGLGALFGVTGGYMAGWLLSAAIIALFEKFSRDKAAIRFSGMLLGLFADYALGTVWFMAVYSKTTGPVGLLSSLGLCVFPYIIPDIIKLFLVLVVCRKLEKFRVAAK